MPIQRLGAVTAETYYGEGSGLEAFQRVVVQGYLGRKAQRANLVLPDVDDVAEGAPLPVFLQRDQWVAGCPDCQGDLQLAWSTVPLFMCSRCWNVAVGGSWRSVAFPEERTKIEAAAGERSDRSERNWLPGEAAEEVASGQGIVAKRPRDVFARLQPSFGTAQDERPFDGAQDERGS